MEIIQSPLIERVLTAEEQKRLSPDDVLNGLKEGNKRFAAGNLTLRDHSKQIRDAVLCRQVERPDDRVNSPVVRVLTKFTALFLLYSRTHKVGCKIDGSCAARSFDLTIYPVDLNLVQASRLDFCQLV